MYWKLCCSASALLSWESPSRSLSRTSWGTLHPHPFRSAKRVRRKFGSNSWAWGSNGLLMAIFPCSVGTGSIFNIGNLLLLFLHLLHVFKFNAGTNVRQKSRSKLSLIHFSSWRKMVDLPAFVRGWHATNSGSPTLWGVSLYDWFLRGVDPQYTCRRAQPVFRIFSNIPKPMYFFAWYFMQLLLILLLFQVFFFHETVIWNR